MALERHGDYIYGTQEEIDNYQNQQSASNIGGAVAIGSIAIVLAVAALFVSASASIKEKARISADQIKTWHNMYSKLWGTDKADRMLSKARKRLRFRSFKFAIIGMLFPILYIAGIPFLLGIMFGLPVLLAADARNFEILPYSLSEIWYSRSDLFRDLVDSVYATVGDHFMLIGILYLIVIAIIVPFYVRMSKKSFDSALLTTYNNLIYQSYPKKKCPYCRRRTRVLSLGQCRDCFKFLRRLSLEDAKAVSEYRMNVQYDVFKTERNEFFSAEIGRTLQWRRGWLVVLLMFTLPIALFMVGIYTGAWFVIPFITDGSSGGFFPPELLIILGTIFGSLFLTFASMKVLGKISNDMTKRDIRNFTNMVKMELARHNLPTDNWAV